MKKELLVWGLLIFTAVAAVFIFRVVNDSDKEVELPESVKKEAVENKTKPGTDIVKGVDSSLPNYDKGKEEEQSDIDLAEEDLPVQDMEESAEQPPEVPTVDPELHRVAVMINGKPVTLGDVVPPGVIESGGTLHEDGYNQFINQAVDRSLLLQKAEDLGLTSTREYNAIQETMRAELGDMSMGGTEEERDWEIKYFTTSAVINELYRKEGLMPQRVSQEEIQTYYENNSVEYEWLRKREAAKGTNADKIERKVLDQIKKDLNFPSQKETREKRKAYLDELRGDANIEYLK